jgi:hypothetical protein
MTPSLSEAQPKSLSSEIAFCMRKGGLFSVDAFSDYLLNPLFEAGLPVQASEDAAREATSAGIETASLFDRLA